MLAILPNGTEIHCTHVADGFHGTTLYSPDEVLKSGIPPKGSDRKLLEHVRGNSASAFRGTTVFPNTSYSGQGAAYWAGDGGWIYEIEEVPSWNVEKELEGKVPIPGGYGNCPIPAELESAIPASVAPDRVIQAFTVRSGRVIHGNQMYLVSPWIPSRRR